MISRSVFAIAALVIGSIGTRAVAADLGPMAPPVLQQSEDASFFGSGWYIRGDLGYSMPQGDKASHNGVAFSNLSVRDSFSVGLGAGYKFNSWLRADVTVDDLIGGDIKGSYAVAGCCFYSDATKLGGYTALANGYADLGTWWGVTPYVGAGIGYAFNQVGAGSGYAYTLPPGGGTPIPVLDVNGKQVVNAYSKHNNNGVAWALMAGASVNIAAGVSLDFGYRYLRVADAKSAPDTLKTSSTFSSLGAHQFRIGLRYLFDQ